MTRSPEIPAEQQLPHRAGQPEPHKLRQPEDNYRPLAYDQNQSSMPTEYDELIRSAKAGNPEAVNSLATLFYSQGILDQAIKWNDGAKH